MTRRAASASNNASATINEILTARLRVVGVDWADGSPLGGGCAWSFGSGLALALLPRKSVAIPGVRPGEFVGTAGSCAGSEEGVGEGAVETFSFIKLPSPRPNADFGTGAFSLR